MPPFASPGRFFSKFWKSLFQFAKPRGYTTHSHKRRSTARLWLEALEARDVPAVFRVMPMFTYGNEGESASVVFLPETIASMAA